MPVFSRRRLQEMIDDLGPWLPASKASELTGRLDGQDTKHAMSAEAELALTWAVQRARSIVVEPKFTGTSTRIDLFAYFMFGEASAAIEITALSDDQFSGKEDMDRAASIIGQYANRFSAHADRHLYFTFADHSFYERDPRTKESRYRRIRRVSPKYRMTAEHEALVRAWVSDPAWPSPTSIRLTSEKIDVIVEWKDFVHPEGRVFCRMPPVAYDLRDNPLYKQLKRKARQLGAVPEGVVRCVFVVDAGCNLLRHLSPMSSTGREKGGAEIIQHFLKDAKVDVVCVFSQHRTHQILGQRREPPIRWKVTYLERRQAAPQCVSEGLQQIANLLPMPNLEGYAARSLHRQGAFGPENLKGLGGWQSVSQGKEMTVEVSSRLLQALLAGRITQEQFQHQTFRDGVNQFDHQLRRGMILKGVQLKPNGVDNDDDWISFELSEDPSACPLRPAPAAPLKERGKAWLARALLPLFVWTRRRTSFPNGSVGAADGPRTDSRQRHDP